jgi:hypothetical protein
MNNQQTQTTYSHKQLKKSRHNKKLKDHKNNKDPKRKFKIHKNHKDLGLGLNF